MNPHLFIEEEGEGNGHRGPEPTTSHPCPPRSLSNVILNFSAPFHKTHRSQTTVLTSRICYTHLCFLSHLHIACYNHSRLPHVHGDGIRVRLSHSRMLLITCVIAVCSVCVKGTRNHQTAVWYGPCLALVALCSRGHGCFVCLWWFGCVVYAFGSHAVEGDL